jgi:hypothetical protein
LKALSNAKWVEFSQKSALSMWETLREIRRKIGMRPSSSGRRRSCGITLRCNGGRGNLRCDRVIWTSPLSR